MAKPDGQVGGFLSGILYGVLASAIVLIGLAVVYPLQRSSDATSQSVTPQTDAAEVDLHETQGEAPVRASEATPAPAQDISPAVESGPAIDVVTLPGSGGSPDVSVPTLGAGGFGADAPGSEAVVAIGGQGSARPQIGSGVSGLATPGGGDAPAIDSASTERPVVDTLDGQSEETETAEVVEPEGNEDPPVMETPALETIAETEVAEESVPSETTEVEVAEEDNAAPDETIVAEVEEAPTVTESIIEPAAQEPVQIATDATLPNEAIPAETGRSEGTALASVIDQPGVDQGPAVDLDTSRPQPQKNKKALAAEVQAKLAEEAKREKAKQQETAALAPSPEQLRTATATGARVLGPEETIYLDRLPPATLIQASAFETNRRQFEAPERRPVLSIVLIDSGTEGVGRDALRSLQVPITFAIPVNMVGAADIARDYADRGFETVSMLPFVGDEVYEKGTNPEAMSDSIPAFLAAIPGSVALMDRVDGPLPRDANLARAALAGLQISGHGLLTHRASGVNTVARQARSFGVPSAAIARVIDSGAGRQNIRIALDRAVLDASKAGAAVVVGRTDPDTMTTLVSWLLGTGSKSVLLAPVSTAMLRLGER